jgi:3-methyladenine DNA glycosylase AlkD
MKGRSQSSSIQKKQSDDERNFVRKAVNWALRNIGKRNQKLNREAVRAAEKLRRRDSRAAKRIAADALRELRGDAAQRRLREKKADR